MGALQGQVETLGHRKLTRTRRAQDHVPKLLPCSHKNGHYQPNGYLHKQASMYVAILEMPASWRASNSFKLAPKGK